MISGAEIGRSAPTIASATRRCHRWIAWFRKPDSFEQPIDEARPFGQESGRELGIWLPKPPAALTLRRVLQGFLPSIKSKKVRVGGTTVRSQKLVRHSNQQLAIRGRRRAVEVVGCYNG